MWAGALNTYRMRPLETDPQNLPIDDEEIAYPFKGSRNSQETCGGHIEKDTMRFLNQGKYSFMTHTIFHRFLVGNLRKIHTDI